MKTFVVAVSFWVSDEEMAEVRQYQVDARDAYSAGEIADGLSVEDEYYTTFKRVVENVLEVK